MNHLEIAALKDKILYYLAKHPKKYVDDDVLKKDLHLMTISQGIISGYIEEMEDEGVVAAVHTKGGGAIKINDKGEKFLSEGGYAQIAQQVVKECALSNRKTRLEILSLKLNPWLSIIAIIISAIALYISIKK